MINLMIATLILISPLKMQSDDCGNGLPCGPLPWSVPQYPVILSPTAIPTTFIQATATPLPQPTEDPAITNTPMPTEAPTVDTEPLSTVVSDIEELIDATAIPAFEVNDTTIDFSSIDEFSGVTFWGYVRGLFSVDLGAIQPIVTIVTVGIFLFIFVQLSTYILQVIALLIGLVMRIISFLRGFIPGFGG